MGKYLLLIVSFAFGGLAYGQTPFDMDRVADETVLSDLAVDTVRKDVAGAAAVPATEHGWGVPYSLTGVLSVQDEKVTLNTSDGRIFLLALDADKAAKLNGETVFVSAMARASDNLALLKVKHFSRVPVSKEEVVVPFKASSRPPFLAGTRADGFTVGNVRWSVLGEKGKIISDWRNTIIKPDLVDRVYFIKKPFNPEWLAAHALMMVTFKPGGLVDAQGNQAKGLVLSIEAYLREGQNYSLQAGLGRNFSIIWSMTTWEAYVRKTCLEDSQRLIAYPVLLSAEQKQALVKEIVAQGTVNREGEFYNTLTNNCTNNLVILLNRVIGPDRAINLWRLPNLVYNFKATMPTRTPAYLIKHGLLGNELPPVTSKNAEAAVNGF